MKTRIAVISDTHSLLRPEVEEIIGTCDRILHAGDIASAEIRDRIAGLAPSVFVRGNADKEWAKDIPAETDLEIAGFRFYMVHNIKHTRKDLSGVDCVIYGHSHKYEVKEDGPVTYLNPGSCGPRRFTQPVTMMVISLDEEQHTAEIEKHDLSPVLKRGTKCPPRNEMDKVIKGIIKDMNANRTVEQISERNRVEVELVNEILQIYTTHPGIDIDGILNRMHEQ